MAALLPQARTGSRGRGVVENADPLTSASRRSRDWFHRQDQIMTHAVVWIDHKEARIFHVHPEAADESTILSPQHHIHRHPKGHGEPRAHPDDARHFFYDAAPA